MTQYLLRNIDPEIWAQACARAQRDQVTLRAVLLALVEFYAAGNGTLTRQRFVSTADGVGTRTPEEVATHAAKRFYRAKE